MVGQLLEGGRSLLPESSVSRGSYFVRYVNVKIECERQPKLQARLHSGGVGFDRLIEGFTELGKLLNVGYTSGDVVFVAVNPAHKLGVLPASQRTLESATKTHRPGDAAVTFNASPVRRVAPANQSQQGGFSRTVTSDQPHVELGRNGEGNPLQNPLARAMIGLVTLVHVFNNDHCAINLDANRPCRASPRKIAPKAKP